METSTGLQGTFSENRRKVLTNAPDCLVYLNGELTLPSGATPGKRINIQPLVTDVSVSLGVEQSPGNASISLHIPSHYKEDFFRAGRLLLTNMMEVRIYMKGNFLVGGAPRYYPAFWGLTTSANWSWSGGQRTVSLSCQDILYWWTIQRIAVNASHQGAGLPTIGGFNTQGNGIFTNSNPYDVIYTLSRQAYGDAVIEDNYQASGRHKSSEPNAEENAALMAYWQKQWGRIAYALRMYGPRGDLLEGDLLEGVLSSQNAQAARQGREGQATRKQSPKFDFSQDINFSEVSAFSQVLSSIGDIDIFTSEFQTKKEIADTTRDAIGYEFFMDVTGEIVFKPPFYNLDVINNKPVSWIRPVDIISENFAENEPNATFLEGTGNMVRNTNIGGGDLEKPRATYIDYRLVQKYGWRPGSYNSEFIGAGMGGSAPRNLFYHLVDQLDRENARIHSGDVTIPIRPELRLGYPIYYEDQDAFWYIDSISHQFSYGSQCTTTLTLMARRAKFYAKFDYWNTNEGDTSPTQNVHDVEPYQSRTNQDNQPPPGATAKPNVYPENIHNRPIDAKSGDPVPDRNVILKAVPLSEEEKEEEGRNVGAFDDVEDGETEAERVTRDLVDFRTQFRIFGPNEFAYVIDPDRDDRLQYNETGQKTGGPITSIRLEPTEFGGRTRVMPTMPVSDERGYEVIGTYEYGRTAQLTRKGFDFTRQGSRRAKQFASMSPEHQTMGERDESFANNEELSEEDRVAQVDPNNYGRRLLDVKPIGPESYNYAEGARNLVQGMDFSGGNGDIPLPEGERDFVKSARVTRWQEQGIIEEARQEVGVTEDQYSDELILSFIHTESSGDPGARRTNDNGKLSEYCGLLQIGNDNAASQGKNNTDFLPSNPNDQDSQNEAGKDSIVHFLRYAENYSSDHDYDQDRIAMTWKGGPGTLRTYNDLEDSGQESAALAHLSNFHDTDKYLANMRNARSVYADEEAQVVEQPAPDHDQINTFGVPPEDGDNLGINRDSNKLFANALEDNLRENRNVLPSNVRPVRDPGLMSHIVDFLKAVHHEGFEQEKEIESELRGETKSIVRVPDQASRAVDTPSDDQLVDSPLGRPEIQDALDKGESISDVFGPEGRWTEVEEKWQKSGQDFGEAKQGLGESFSNMSPSSDDNEDSNSDDNNEE